MNDNINQITALKQAIKEGLESGRVIDFNPEKHLASLKSKAKDLNYKKDCFVVPPRNDEREEN